MSGSLYLNVSAELVPGFDKLLGYDARCGSNDIGGFTYRVRDKDIRDALAKYLFSDALTKCLPIGRLYETWSPREFLERLGYDPQRLDALKAQ